MSPPVDFATVVLLDVATAIGTFSILALMLGLGVLRGPTGPSHPQSPAAPTQAPAPDLDRERSLCLAELRAAMACYDLVDEIIRADGDGPTERDRTACIFAEWTLARTAERYGRAYTRAVDAEASP